MIKSKAYSQLTFTYSILTTETEKGVKKVQS